MSGGTAIIFGAEIYLDVRSFVKQESGRRSFLGTIFITRDSLNVFSLSVTWSQHPKFRYEKWTEIAAKWETRDGGTWPPSFLLSNFFYY